MYSIPYTLVARDNLGKWRPILPSTDFPDCLGEGIWKFVKDCVEH